MAGYWMLAAPAALMAVAVDEDEIISQRCRCHTVQESVDLFRAATWHAGDEVVLKVHDGELQQIEVRRQVGQPVCAVQPHLVLWSAVADLLRCCYGEMRFAIDPNGVLVHEETTFRPPLEADEERADFRSRFIAGYGYCAGDRYAYNEARRRAHVTRVNLPPATRAVEGLIFR